MKRFHTHDTFNQSPAWENESENLFTSDPVLTRLVNFVGADKEAFQKFGKYLGSPYIKQQGQKANEYPPVLKTHDSKGFRKDQVDFHPSYHEMMALSMKEGLHNLTWQNSLTGEPPSTHVGLVRSMKFYMMAQAESGHCCPITMTHAAAPLLLQNPELSQTWLPPLLKNEYDPRFIPITEKKSATFGMAMTEKQGGTDIQTVTTQATPKDSHYLITGHKWFCSAPMCDAFFILAQAPGGLSCFLVPRFTTEGKVNELRFIRLKNKLGNKSNASSELELEQAQGFLVGNEGRGVKTIIEMTNFCRMDCAVSSAGLMKQALNHTLHHCNHRKVFGKPLDNHPLMKNVLSNLTLEWEACAHLAFKLMQAFDKSYTSDFDKAYVRVMTPVSKYWICKRGPLFVYEAMECLGGNGYIEEEVLSRIYKEMPVNAIWEGSGNVMCLDVLRTLQKTPEYLQVLMSEWKSAITQSTSYKKLLTETQELLNSENPEACGRQITECLAKLSMGYELFKHCPDFVGQAFCETQIEAAAQVSFGGAACSIDPSKLIQRAKNT